MRGAQTPQRLREGLHAAVLRAELEGELSVEDSERLALLAEEGHLKCIQTWCTDALLWHNSEGRGR